MAVLRAVMTMFGILALGGAVVALLCGAPFPVVVWFAGVGIIVTLGVVFERIHYKRLDAGTPEAGWVATAERFVDPETGKLVVVYMRPASGERRYVVIGDPPA
jgi:hypothetical protein